VEREIAGRATSIAVLLVAATSLVGCSTPGSPSAPAATPASASPASIATPSPTAAFEVEHRELETAFAGDERIVQLFLPKLPAGAKAPLVIVLHALGSTPSGEVQETRFDLVAERNGAIVAFPPSAGRGWDALVCCGDPVEPNEDTRYLDALIDHLSAEFPVDAKRVFVTGFSIGAVMTDRLGCQFADRVAAIAIDAGTPWSDTCNPAKPVSVLVMHGTGDNTFKYATAQELADRWRRVDRCPGSPATRQITPRASAVSSTGCAEGTAVEFVTIEGAPHQWFGDPDATELAWQFFAAHPRR
jgi:polyhydroxybutyrate depolymerase